MTTVGPASIATRRKKNRNRQFASTMVHYLGVEQALEACREKEWHDVRDEILSQHPAEGAESQAP